MRWKAAVGLCALATALAVSSFAQDRLEDVAGSIRLNRSGADEAMVEGRQPARSTRSSGSQSEGSILKQIVEDGLVQSRRLNALLEEVRTPGVFTDAGWRRRIDEVGLGIDRLKLDLLGISHSGRYETAYSLAAQGADLSVASGVAVREGIAQNRLRIKEPIAQVEDGIGLLESALRSVEAGLREENWESVPSPVDPVSAAATIKNFCLGKYAEESQQHAKCVGEQDAAYRAGLTRFPFSVGLPEAEFNTIRNTCRFEWPNDFGSQNRCEVERMARQARP